ncbi:MAG: hypothetical protein AAF636_17795 [Pseudomonadota bacterium]
MKLAPLSDPRGRSAGAASPQILAHRPSLVPSDPQHMLVDRGYARPKRRSLLIPALAVLAIFAEVFAPVSWKPSKIAGDGAARFYFAIMTADNVKHVELVEMDIAARVLAEREAEYSAWMGRCSILNQFDQQLGMECGRATQAFYTGAIRDARRARARLQTGGLQ